MNQIRSCLVGAEIRAVFPDRLPHCLFAASSSGPALWGCVPPSHRSSRLPDYPQWRLVPCLAFE